MTRSNRVLNRIITALVGLALIAAGLWVANDTYRVIEPIAIPTLDATGLWIVAASAALLVVLALAWILTRGRGSTRSLVTRSDDAGQASLDARVAADFIIEDVSRVADVVSVSARAFRVRSTVSLELRVTTRAAADLRHVLDAVNRAVVELDEVLEERIPVLLHVATGVRASLAHEQRVR